MLVRTPAGEAAALDYRSVAPGGARPDMFVVDGGDRGSGADRASELGHRAAAVPGTVRGLWEAHQRFGTRPWPALVEPAAELARGFVVRKRLTRSYEPHIVEGLRRFPESARIFLPDGRPPAVGDTFRQPELARTLERVRDHGPDGFYGGETAAAIAADMERGGGLITAGDLRVYRAAWREPLRFGYRGRTLLSMPPSSSGGVTLAAMCGILEGFPLGEVPWHDARHVHLLAEAWRRAYADRNHYLADPAFARIPVDTLASPGYGAWRAASIDPGRATPSADVGPGVDAYRAESSHTTHLSVVDAAGGAVSLTTTLNTWYGSKVVVPGTGVLLNSDMDDFTTRPGEPNFFGLVQGEANGVEPGKRPVSTMTPSMVLEGGRLALVLGTPGGSTIMTTVFQVLSNLLDHGMTLDAAVAAPRVHHQHRPDRIFTDPGGLGDDVADRLRAMGHDVGPWEEPIGDVQAVAILPDGTLRGCSDPRRGGTALGA